MLSGYLPDYQKPRFIAGFNRNLNYVGVIQHLLCRVEIDPMFFLIAIAFLFIKFKFQKITLSVD